MSDSEVTQADADKLVRYANDRLGSITSPKMEGDNLSILLAGVFDNPDQDEDDEYGWTPDAVAGCNEVLAAIKAHYAPAFETLTAERDRMAAELAEAVKQVKALTTAITYADPPKLFNSVLCHEARVPVEFITDARAFLARHEQENGHGE